jgi:hypothetical protein
MPLAVFPLYFLGMTDYVAKPPLLPPIGYEVCGWLQNGWLDVLKLKHVTFHDRGYGFEPSKPY